MIVARPVLWDKKLIAIYYPKIVYIFSLFAVKYLCCFEPSFELQDGMLKHHGCGKFEQKTHCLAASGDQYAKLKFTSTLQPCHGFTFISKSTSIVAKRGEQIPLCYRYQKTQMRPSSCPGKLYRVYQYLYLFPM